MRAAEFLENADIQYSLVTPDQLPTEVIQSIAELIAAGGEVAPGVVMRNLNSAQSIAYASDAGTPVGVIVLKNPLPEYRRKVFAAAGIPNQERNYNTELGYVYLIPRYREQGVAAQLLRLMNRSAPSNSFATTRENNTTINKILQFAGYRVTGRPYPSARGDYNLLLWTKQ
jgi:GNAT superfamily N-acetyltransferase